jgi:hypothetical protein
MKYLYALGVSAVVNQKSMQTRISNNDQPSCQFVAKKFDLTKINPYSGLILYSYFRAFMLKSLNMISIGTTEGAATYTHNTNLAIKNK